LALVRHVVCSFGSQRAVHANRDAAGRQHCHHPLWTAGAPAGCCNGFIMLHYIYNVVKTTYGGAAVNTFFGDQKRPSGSSQGYKILLDYQMCPCLDNREAMPSIKKNSSQITGSKRQAENLSQTRREHASEIAEDYAEAIADLILETGEARVVDLARRVGVTHVTVIRTIARLQKAGYVTAQPYRAIFLTAKGRALAAKCKRRHETVAAFLESLGISKRAAELDAEGIEHHVSPETLAAFERRLGKK
jgi:DtxR family transcriptional regulator, manganese transport regulator